ncbi:putative amino acid permease/ SLC12A domain-containing protein [Septoria linicola]|nr:putative amino acid permease/ SLC12A domain-containing protein [Septoria linicola]
MPASMVSSGRGTRNQTDKKNERVLVCETSSDDGPEGYASGSGSSTGSIRIGLKRDLGNRQLQLITMGGAIGTALFLSIGIGLAKGGPLSLLISWSLYALNMSFVNSALAEMTVLYPVEGGFVRLAEHFVGPDFAFGVGYNYFLYELVLIPFEITALNTVLGYWFTDYRYPWIVVSLVIFSYVLFNIISVKWYGEFEFWLSSGKVFLLLLLISFTVFTMLGANPERDIYGFRYWKDPGPLATYRTSGDLGRFEGFLGSLWSAAFAIVGPEYVSSVAGEAARPRVNIKAAFKTVFWRFLCFFVMSAMCVGIVIPYNDKALVEFVFGKSAGGGTAAASPYVIAMDNLRINGLPNLVNALMLTSVYSAGNTYFYVASRNLYGLALEGKAPKLCKKIWNGVPIICYVIVTVFSCLALLGCSKGSAKVLGYFTSVITGGGILNYANMCVTYLFFYRAVKVQGLDREQFPYRGWFQPYATWVALVVEVLIILFVGYTTVVPFDATGFFTHYGMLIAESVLIVGWKVCRRTTLVRAEDVDLEWVRPEIDEYEANLTGHDKGFWREVLEYFRLRRKEDSPTEAVTLGTIRRGSDSRGEGEEMR